MPFACPACAASVDGTPEGPLRRCPRCRGWIRCRALDSDATLRRYSVEALGRPESRRVVESPWSERDEARLDAWLRWASLVTLALVGVLAALAWVWR